VSLYSDNDPDVTADKLRLSGLDATGKHDPAQVNDRLTISFSLKNTGDQPIEMSPFIGARDPAKSHADFAEENENRTFAPGEEMKIKGSIVLDKKGQWEFWPCYGIADRFCPDEWRAFKVVVQ